MKSIQEMRSELVNIKTDEDFLTFGGYLTPLRKYESKYINISGWERVVLVYELFNKETNEIGYYYWKVPANDVGLKNEFCVRIVDSDIVIQVEYESLNRNIQGIANTLYSYKEMMNTSKRDYEMRNIVDFLNGKDNE